MLNVTIDEEDTNNRVPIACSLSSHQKQQLLCTSLEKPRGWFSDLLFRAFRGRSHVSCGWEHDLNWIPPAPALVSSMYNPRCTYVNDWQQRLQIRSMIRFPESEAWLSPVEFARETIVWKRAAIAYLESALQTMLLDSNFLPIQDLCHTVASYCDVTRHVVVFIQQHIDDYRRRRTPM